MCFKLPSRHVTTRRMNVSAYARRPRREIYIYKNVSIILYMILDILLLNLNVSISHLCSFDAFLQVHMNLMLIYYWRISEAYTAWHIVAFVANGTDSVNLQVRLPDRNRIVSRCLDWFMSICLLKYLCPYSGVCNPSCCMHGLINNLHG